MRDLDFPKEYKASMAGQIEQETCISLTSKSCWNPKAELKTSRELGWGLSQTTIAYNKDGTERFNVYKELVKSNPELKDWQWNDRYNPLYQIKALLIENRNVYVRLSFPFDNEFEKTAAMEVGYNSGYGNVMKSRLRCINTAGCDPKKWFGGIETTNAASDKSLGPQYGNKSPKDISNAYPFNILKVRMKKYEPYVN